MIIVARIVRTGYRQNHLSLVISFCTHLIHILVFTLIYFLFTRNLILAFFVAALFAVHPMHVESVAWISARKDVLSSFFFLLGLITWYKYLSDKARKYIWLTLAFMLFILACLSKATAVVFPVIAILIRYFTISNEEENSYKSALLKTFSLRTLLALMPFFAASLFFGLMAVRIQGGENFLGMLKFMKEPDSVINIVAPFSWLQRSQVASYGFWVYLIKFVFPVNQSCFYPYPDANEMNHGNFPIILWLSLLGFMITFLLVVFSMRKTKLFFFCFGFSLVMMLLVLQFISVGKAILAERYTYLPYIGIFDHSCIFYLAIYRQEQKMAAIIIRVLCIGYDVSCKETGKCMV